MAAPDAVVIGAGPNGLAAAIVLAQAGRDVVVYEADDSIGGGCRSEALTLPGFVHDVCSAVYPMAVASPFLRTLPLEQHGLHWIHSPAVVAHPFDGDTPAAVVERSLAATARALGPDEQGYQRLIGQSVHAWPKLDAWLLGPPRMPSTGSLVPAARFGVSALQSSVWLARRHFQDPRARALFAGLAAHGMLRLDRAPSGAIALVLGTVAHTHGWPIPRGGAQRLAEAMASYLRSLGGRIVTGTRVSALSQLPASRAVLCDLSPRPFLQLAGPILTGPYRRTLERYRYGVGSYKVDFALDGPVPWRDPTVSRAATVHVGGKPEEIAASEEDAWHGRLCTRPFVLVAQPSLFDDRRAPAGRHTLWAYCHVPRASAAHMLPHVEAQIERFAPGFRDRILARHVITPRDLEHRNPNLVGGDIAMGVPDLRQTFARPGWRQYRTPRRGLYLCSAATPPGIGVHGMCGYHAARQALRDVLA